MGTYNSDCGINVLEDDADCPEVLSQKVDLALDEDRKFSVDFSGRSEGRTKDISSSSVKDRSDVLCATLNGSNGSLGNCGVHIGLVRDRGDAGLWAKHKGCQSTFFFDSIAMVV